MQRSVRLAAAGATLVVLGAALPAQDLEAKLEAKLASKWLKKAPWILDWDEARALAKKKDKLIFAYFTRSYAP